MINKKYTVTKKNGGCVPNFPIKEYKIEEEPIWEQGIDPKFPNAYVNTGKTKTKKIPVYDTRVAEVMIPCGRCQECLAAKARNWTARLIEEIPQTKYNYFITLTFDPIQLSILKKKTGLDECNPLVGIAIRRMLERWRKTYKKSLKHFFITELGHEGSERIHAHGLIMSDIPITVEPIETAPKGGMMAKWKYWKYGHIFVGDYVSGRTINYLMKYVTKIDTDHKNFIGYIFCSPGLGKAWLERMQNIYKYIPGSHLDYMRLPNGSKVKLPVYYKNKCYNEEERELIWREFMDGNQTTIAGNNYCSDQITSTDIENITRKAQEINKKLGYGDDTQEWRKLPYCITPAMLRKGQNTDQAHAHELAEHLAKMAELKKIRKKMQKNLEISKKSSTFVP